MDFDLSSAFDTLRISINNESFDGAVTIGSAESRCKSEQKRTRKHIEETKSQMTVPADASIIVQTNFGPQLQSHIANIDKSKKTTKKQRMDSFPLSRLRYINLGKWNYNWGDRIYQHIDHALALPDQLVSLAQRAHKLALQQIGDAVVAAAPPVPFDMAICNLYHLQRPSDRLGGHQDNVESDLSLPLVSISLGASGIFLLGGNSRKDVPTVILLRAGDCMVMSGRSRRYFHGLPTVLSQLEVGRASGAAAAAPAEASMAVFPELSEGGTPQKIAGINNDTESMACLPLLDELKFVKAFLTTVRMNLSIRQI